MSNIVLNSTEMQFVYIDPNAPHINSSQTEGDGSSPDTCLFSFPTNPNMYLPNALYIVRRSANQYGAEIPSLEIPKAKTFAVWGMPICQYQPTTHTTFQEGTTYYKCYTEEDDNDLVFREVEVTPGTEVPLNTAGETLVSLYFERTNHVDPLWDLMPKNVKIKWFDAVSTNNTSLNTELANYACIQHSTNNSGITINNCSYIDMRNIVLTNGYVDNQYTINQTSDTLPCSFNLNNVWFRDVSTFVDGIPQLWTTGDARPNNGYYTGGKFLNLNQRSPMAQYGSITNSRVDVSGGYSNSIGHIAFGHCKYVNISDVRVNLVQGTRCNVFVMNPVNDSFNRGELVINDVVAKYWYYNDAYDHGFATIIGATCETITATRCSYTKADTSLLVGDSNSWWTSPKRNGLHFRNFLEVYTSSAGSEISHINIEYPDSTGRSCSGIFVAHNPWGEASIGQVGQYCKLHNINITCCTTETPWTYEEYGEEHVFNSNADNNYMLKVLPQASTNIPSFDCLLQDVHITVPYGKAIYADRALIDMNNCDIEGAIRLKNSIGKIKSVSHYRPGEIFLDEGGNTLYIGSLICDRTGKLFEYTGQHALLPSGRSYVLVNKCNILLTANTPEERFTSNRPSMYICTNDNNFNGDGHYSVRTCFTYCKTWSVARQGSGTGCSLKLYNETQSEPNNPLRIGGAPFKGVIKHIGVGKQNIKIYAITNGYSNPDDIKKNLAVKVTANNQIYTSVLGKWSEDTESVWDNIEGGGVKAYVFEMELESTYEQDISFEYTFNWHMVGGAVYLDPHPIITPVN